MSRVDKIIDLIDVGLQTPMPDPTYGEVSPVNRETCFRCNRPPEEGSDMCASCRAFMLGDSEEDPAERRAFTPPIRSGLDNVTVYDVAETAREGMVFHSRIHVSLHTDPPAVHSHGVPEVSGAGYARQPVSWVEETQVRVDGGAVLSVGEVAVRLGIQAQEFIDAMDRVTAAFTSSSQVIEELHEENQRAATSPRRRHGHAAVCPRHGETRGGTCLRCVR